MSDEAHEATPDHELERQIMSYNEAKNEREWWAMHEIERLREALRKWDALIQYQYNGSREAMSALQECAFETDAILKGYTLEEKSDD